MNEGIFKELMRYDPYETERMNKLVKILDEDLLNLINDKEKAEEAGN
tara:strand:+ start:183 stop:323 length:141 start_codon:yes stop_codon:yes gene_type:complete